MYIFFSFCTYLYIYIHTYISRCDTSHPVLLKFSSSWLQSTGIRLVVTVLRLLLALWILTTPCTTRLLLIRPRRCCTKSWVKCPGLATGTRWLLWPRARVLVRRFFGWLWALFLSIAVALLQAGKHADANAWFCFFFNKCQTPTRTQWLSRHMALPACMQTTQTLANVRHHGG